MKLLLKISLLFLVPLFAKSQTQQQQADSLHLALKMAANDTVKMVVVQKLQGHYLEIDRDSSLFFAEQALDLSKKIKQPIWTARILLIKAYTLILQGNLPLAFKLINEAMAIAKEVKNEKNIYIEKDSRSNGDPHKLRLGILALGFHQLGNMYKQAGNMEKAISNFKEVIRIAEDISNENHLVNSNMNIGSIYLYNLDKLDSAWLYTSKALKYSNSTGYKTYQGYILQDIGTIFLKRKQLDSASHYYWKSLSISREKSNFASEIWASISLAQLYKSISQTDSMLYYATTAFKMAVNLKSGTQIATSAELISNAFKRRGNKDSALAYLSISKKMADSLNEVKTEKLTEFQNIGFEEQMQLEKTAQENIAYKNKIRTIGLFTGLGLLSVLAFVFYRNNRQKQKANKVLESTLTNLKSTQSQLIQSEKMASLGELTAGIAHEIQNPLNFVNNFSEVSTELVDEMNEEIDKGNLTDAKEIANDLKQNLEKINHHGKRAGDIVKGMLQHSRNSSGVKEPTDINALCDEYLRLSYHGLRAKDKNFNATMKTDFDESIGSINIIPQDIGRVILNLINNAFYAAPLPPPAGGGFLDPDYKHNPIVWVSTKRINSPLGDGGKVEIKVKDNGPGMPQKILDKIFQPFFTTKPTGQGTGLGFSLSYDIVKAHGGELKVETKEGVGTEFAVLLPG